MTSRWRKSRTVRTNHRIDVGRAVALATLTLRSDDGSAATPIPFVFGTPRRLPVHTAQFPGATCVHALVSSHSFRLERAKQFRLGPRPALSQCRVHRRLQRSKSLGIATVPPLRQTRRSSPVLERSDSELLERDHSGGGQAHHPHDRTERPCVRVAQSHPCRSK